VGAESRRSKHVSSVHVWLFMLTPMLHCGCRDSIKLCTHTHPQIHRPASCTFKDDRLRHHRSHILTHNPIYIYTHTHANTFFVRNQKRKKLGLTRADVHPHMHTHLETHVRVGIKGNPPFINVRMLLRVILWARWSEVSLA
jgi:hypothetical protein